MIIELDESRFNNLISFSFTYKAKDLIEAVEKVRTEDSDDSDNDENDAEQTVSGEKLSDETKIHRILLLRSWLLHFVGTLHSYFMTRVVHSTELELQADLADCTDLVSRL